jgi:hypothetical protein
VIEAQRHAPPRPAVGLPEELLVAEGRREFYRPAIGDIEIVPEHLKVGWKTRHGFVRFRD